MITRDSPVCQPLIKDVVCNMVRSGDGAVELLAVKRVDLVRTLQDIQPWINILRTWDTLSSQQQHVSASESSVYQDKCTVI